MTDSVWSRRSESPVCESCWIETHAVWEPESVSEDGKILMKLKSIEVPEKRNTGEAESCSVCDALTVAGIYAAEGGSDFDYEDYESLDPGDWA